MTEEIISLDLILIKTSGGTQSRTGVDKRVVDEYAEAMQERTLFPPLDVFHDGKDYWLADGFHRYYAASKLGIRQIGVKVHQGDRRDAILHSVGANSQHGLRRTNADKHRAVEVLLKDEEWMQWSDREIARRTGTHHDTVGRIRSELSGGNRQIERTVTRNGTTYTQKNEKTAKNTADIPSLDAELEKSRQEAGRSGMLATMQSEAAYRNGAIAVVKEGLPIMANLEIAADVVKTIEQILPLVENEDEDEDELETFMPHTLYAACNSEQVNYLINKIGGKKVAKQFVELTPENKNEIRDFYPGIDDLVKVELGEDIIEAIKLDDDMPVEKSTPINYRIGDEIRIVDAWDGKDIGETATVVGLSENKIAVRIGKDSRVRGFHSDSIELIENYSARPTQNVTAVEIESVEGAYKKFLEDENLRLRDENNRLRLELMECQRANKKNSFVGNRVKVISEESLNFGKAGIALQGTIKEKNGRIEITYSVQLDEASMKNSFLESELERIKND